MNSKTYYINTIVILNLVFFFLFETVCSQTNIDINQLVGFENFLNKEIKNGEIAGAEVLIFKNKKIIWHKNLGYKNYLSKISLKKNSIYYIQSMTKPIISVAIMQLIEKGLLKLNDLAEIYIPEMKNLKVIIDPNQGINGPKRDLERKITIKQLLTHTSGLSHGLGENLYEKQLFKLMYNELFDPADYNKLEERIEALFKAPLVGQPGEKWYYSASTDVLALILQRITNKPINIYLKENIFDPLEMDDTGYNVNLSKEDRIMLVHLKNEEGELILSPTQVEIQGNNLYGGTHGLFSSIEDYLEFCKMILNNGILNGKKILSKKSINLMIKNHVGNFLGPSRGFGLGFGILVDAEKESSPANNGQIYWGGYFKTHFFIDSKEDLIAIFMTQKFPNSYEYIVELNKHIYKAIR
ncbi:MAG: serine hydrolase domain-containing protein [Flavobacteriaceae bacterium]